MARTLDQLAIIANQIKDATLQGENTADRVGGLLVDLIDFLRTINVDEITLSPLLTALNKSGLVDPQDGQILKFKSSEDNWVFSSDIAQITNTIRTILDTLGHLDNEFVKKTGDIMTGLLTTLAGIKVRNFLQLGDRFVSGLLGEGAIFRENVGGRTYLEADEIYIRVKAYFDTVEIRKFLHSGGNRIASLGGAKCVRVEMLNSNNEVVTQNPAKYRCYFRASDGDDTITNDFVIGDQAYCHVTNATNSSLSMHHYWRLVIGKNEIPNENGEHWIDLSNQESETIDGIAYSGYLNISDAPAAQDDIIQLGNVNDSTRRGAIIEFVSGNDAPAYQIFQDLGSIGSATTIAQKHDAQYSYNGKNYISLGYNSSTGRAFMNVYGDFLFGDPEESTYVKYNAFTKQLDIKATVHFISPTTHQETTLDTFASAITGGLENIQRQIDGEIDTWFYNGTPGPSVLPESEWVAIDTQTGTNNERLKHLGDLYYDNSTGYAYRYTNTGSEASPVFTWSQISDSAVIKALEDAAKAQDTADHKRRVFVTSAGVLPTPPYSEGDLWINVTYPANATSTDAANNIYYNDILRCKVPATYNQQGELVREGVESGETALITHWQLSSKYTDDSKFNYFFTNTYSPFVTNIQQQVDRKAETWRQDDDPSLTQGWVPSEHVGDLWMDTNDNDQYGHKTFIYVDHGEGTNPRYSWEPQAVPDEVFDKIDGKAEIFVQKPTTYNERDMWIIESELASTDMPSGCQAGDIVVADNMPSGITKRENSYVKGDWRKKDRYTDDTKVNNLLHNTYVQQLIGGSINQAIADGDAAAVQQAAQAAQTTYGYLTQALSQDTQITGGLILSSMIALRDNDGNMRSGISGTYIERTTPNPEDPDEPYALGHGIAAWYGGENIDHEAFPALTNYAKSLFRFDGTGYLAGGNISWDTDGALTIQGATLRAVEGSSTIEITTAQIASINWVNSNFISKAWFNKFFVAHYKRNNTNYTLAPNNDFPDDATDKTLESVFSFWTNYAISALGQGVDGSHAIGVLDDLNDVNITNAVANQILVYDGTHWRNQNQQSVYELPTASADTLGGVKVGTTLAISSGVLNLPTTGVTAGTYKRVTVDAYGRVTSGDNSDTDTNTWRNIYVGGTSKVGTGIDTKAINFKAGSNVSISFVAAGTGSGQSGSANYFDVVISATDTTYSAATQSAAGLMSAADKKKLDGVAANANNYSLPLAASGTRGGVQIGFTTDAANRNYAVQLSSEKMYVNVPWENTWRGIQNNLTSQSTTDSLSAYQGYLLANGSARDNTKLPLTGGTLTGTLTARDVVVQSAYTLKIGDAILKWDSANNALKLYKLSGSSEVAVNFYATGGVSALGMSEDGSAGAGDVTWALLADGTDTRQIALSHLTTSLTTITGGTTDSTNKKYAVYKNSSNQLFVDVPWQAGSGTVTSIKVGTTSYTPTNGVISLPAYPTSLPASDVYSWAKQSTKPTYAYSEITGTPTIPAAANNGTFSIKTLVGSTTTTISDFTANQSTADDFTLVQGANVTFTLDTTNRKLTIAAKDTTYTLAGLMGSSAKGSTTQPIYWNGSAFANTSYTLGKSVPSDAKFTDTTYSANNGVGLSGTTFYNSGVRATTINGNYLRVNTNGTNADLTIPYATSAGSVAWGNVSSKPTNLFCYQGEVSTAYVNGTTYSTLGSGTYIINLSGHSESLIHFQHGGSSSGLDIKFTYTQAANAPLYYRKTIDSNRFASTDWVTLIDSLNIGSQSVNYATSAGKATQDSDGNAINTTYLKLGGGTMTGNIAMSNNTWVQGWIFTGETGGSTKQYKRAHSIEIGYPAKDTLDFFEYSGTFSFYQTSGVFDVEGSTSKGNLVAQIDTNGVTSAGFIKSGSTSAYVLTGDGGHAAISGLSVSYATSAGSAVSSSNTNSMLITGYGEACLTYYQTVDEFDGNSGWCHYIIANHGNGASYYHYTLGLPFWNVPMYRRQEGDTSHVTQWYRFITEENIASQSVSYATSAGNADTVDGYHESAFLHLSGGTMTGHIYLGGVSSASTANTTQIVFGTANSQHIALSSNPSRLIINASTSDSYNQVCLAVGNNSFDSYVAMNSGNFGIGNSSPTYKLTVAGDAYANNYITSSGNGAYVQIGAIKLMYDSANNAIKVIKSDGTNANLYATGGISALGIGQESGSGGGGDVTWALLASPATGGRTIHSSYISGALSNYLPLSGGTMTGGLSVSMGNPYIDLVTSTRTWDIQVLSDVMYIGAGSSKSIQIDNSGSLKVGNTKLEGGNEINSYDGGNFLYLNYRGGNVAVGTTAPSTYKLTVTGQVGATGFVNTSDIRKKNVIKDVTLRLDQIAKAPAFEYYWLDTNIDNDLHVGSSAQYWQSVLPEVVTTAKDEMGTLSMQYGVAALISAITIARKVMTHEEKIALLETRVSALEKENGEQEQLINSLQEELAKFKAA